jgi:hypothetical protein
MVASTEAEPMRLPRQELAWLLPFADPRPVLRRPRPREHRRSPRRRRASTGTSAGGKDPPEPDLDDPPLRLRSRRDMPEHPRYREGATKDERAWLRRLDDRELVQVARGLAAVDKAVRDFKRKAGKRDAA